MRTRLRTLALLIGVATMPSAHAAAENVGNSPFDFSYRISGSPNLRPTLVFNDGQDTYIELDRTVSISVAGGAATLRQGPYYVVRGIKPEIVLSVQRERAIVTYEPATRLHEADAKTIASLPIQAPVQAPAPTDAQGKVPAGTPAPSPAAKTDQTAQANATPAAAAAPPAPQCTPRTIESNSTVLVSFAAKSHRLSAASSAKLEREAKRRDVRLTSIQLRLPARDGENPLAQRRKDHLSHLLTNAGIPRSLIHVETGLTFDGMTEVVFVNEAKKPCERRPPVVTMREGHLTVISHDADISELMKTMADSMSLPLRIEGTPREIPVAVVVAAEPPSGALAKVGKALGKDADLVLRDKELVLRFN